jgi:large subunit ribosomal protein L19
MSQLVRRVTLERHTTKKKLPDFTSGDTVGVYVRVKEGEKERVQLFRGVVLKVQGSGMGRSFTVRKISNGVGVERTFPFGSPAIDRVEVVAKGKVRRARLFYLRNLRGRAARLDSELVHLESADVGNPDEAAVTADAAADTADVASANDTKGKA